MIRFDQVSKHYADDKIALNRATFHLKRGQMAFITGHSGAGKSTLLKLIMLMERATQGRIIVDNQDLANLNRRQIPWHRRKIGLVFQNHQLLFDYSVFNNIALPLRINGYHERDIGRRVRAALDKVGLLGQEKAMPSTLSTGEQQRVGIARAIVNKPRLLLADEPTGNLDPELAEEIMHLFEQFNQVGVSVLIASHDINLIRHLPYPVMKLGQGRLTHLRASS
jgi:cell division transport system ATP-binding protein